MFPSTALLYSFKLPKPKGRAKHNYTADPAARSIVILSVKPSKGESCEPSTAAAYFERERERMEEAGREKEVVTPGEVLGKASDLMAGRGAYVAPHNNLVYASLTGFRRIVSPPPDSPDQVQVLPQ